MAYYFLYQHILLSKNAFSFLGLWWIFIDLFFSLCFLFNFKCGSRWHRLIFKRMRRSDGTILVFKNDIRYLLLQGCNEYIFVAGMNEFDYTIKCISFGMSLMSPQSLQPLPWTVFLFPNVPLLQGVYSAMVCQGKCIINMFLCVAKYIIIENNEIERTHICRFSFRYSFLKIGAPKRRCSVDIPRDVVGFSLAINCMFGCLEFIWHLVFCWFGFFPNGYVIYLHSVWYRFHLFEVMPYSPFDVHIISTWYDCLFQSCWILWNPNPKAVVWRCFVADVVKRFIFIFVNELQDWVDVGISIVCEHRRADIVLTK